MIQRSQSLDRALEREAVRYAGSLARFCFYKGEIPDSCNDQARGERIGQRNASERDVRDLMIGMGPNMLEGADYWRLYDANGNCVFQGAAP